MIKSAVHHFWNLGRKWLNMRSTDTCTCIHQHYFSRVIVDILFCLFVWRRMKPVNEYINSMATKCCTTVWTHQISAVKTAFMNSSTATAQMLRPVKETSQLNNWKVVVKGFFWPIPPTTTGINGKSSATAINNIIYRLLIYNTLNYFVPPGHLHQVVCEESTEDHQILQPPEPWTAYTVTISRTRTSS